MGHYDDLYDARAEEQERTARQLKAEKTQDALFALENALKDVRAIPAGRETSIAITHIETAILWLKK
jgi:hypothetical protein